MCFDFEWQRRAHPQTSSTAFHGTYVITHVWYSLVRWSVGSDCFLTTTEPLQNLFSIEPRPPHSGDLGPIVLAWIRARLPCSHMPKRTELRGEMCQVPKQRARCENTLIPFFIYKMHISSTNIKQFLIRQKYSVRKAILQREWMKKVFKLR